MFDRPNLRALSAGQKLGLLAASAILGVAALTTLFVVAIVERAVGLATSALVLAAALLAAGWASSRSLLRQLGREPAAAAYIARKIAERERELRLEQRCGDSAGPLHAIPSMRDSLSMQPAAARPSQPGTLSSPRLRHPAPATKPEDARKLPRLVAPSPRSEPPIEDNQRFPDERKHNQTLCGQP